MAASVESMQNRGPVVLAVTIAFLAASTAVVSLRLVSRIGIVRKVSLDDYFIVLAWVRFSARQADWVPHDYMLTWTPSSLPLASPLQFFGART